MIALYFAESYWIPQWIGLNRPPGELPGAEFWVGYDLEIYYDL